MAELDRMAAQFNAALDRLENAATPLLEARSTAARDRAELEALKKERDRLSARIALLEGEAKTISGVTDQVETRLDAAIAEIRSALAQ